MKTSPVLQRVLMWSVVVIAVFSLISTGRFVYGQEIVSSSPVSSGVAQLTPTAADPKTKLEAWQQFFELAQSILTIIAILLGGVWTYFLFIKGRTLTPRLEPKLSLRVFTSGTQKYLLASIQLKNAGTSKVDIVQEGTLLGVFSFEPGMPGAVAKDIKWERHDRAVSILLNHHWIEPGETIEEPALIPLPPGDLAIYKALLRINSKKTTWTVESIIEGALEAPKQDTGQAQD